MSNSDGDFSAPIIAAATQVAKKIRAQVLFAYVSAIEDLASLIGAVKSPTKLILVARDDGDEHRAKDAGARMLRVPSFELTRMGQIKMATLLAFSKRMLQSGDVFVFLSGVAGHGIDTLVAMRVGEEGELFQSIGQPKLTEHIRRAAFEKVLTLSMELAHEGREGKPVGALFVIGDHPEVLKSCIEGRINPFKGYPEKERNVLDDSIRDVVKEMAKLDGAFIIKGKGVIISAGTILRPALAGETLPAGLGARHAAAAAITASTKSIAISLSESTGTVRIWRRGTMIMEIERSARTGAGAGAPTP